MSTQARIINYWIVVLTILIALGTAAQALDNVTTRDLVHHARIAARWGLMTAVYLSVMLLPLWLVIYFS